MARIIKSPKVTFKLLVLFVLLAAFECVAQEEGAVKKEKVLPKSGVLSETVSGGGGSVSEKIPEPWGGTDLQGKDAPPISGSVSKAGKDKWIARIFNNSPDPYSVSLSVDQLSAAGKEVKSDSFSYTLKPGQTVERELSGASNTESCSLQLKSWRNLAPKKKAPEPPPVPAGN